MQLNPEIKRLNSDARLYGYTKPIIGLTGGIATGKSTVTKILRERGLAVICADELVKTIYREEKILDLIRAKAPSAINGPQVHFVELRKLFFTNPELKKLLSEAIYQEMPVSFLSEAKKYSASSFIIYDVPLLFEKNLELKVDTHCLVYATESDQRARLAQRDGTDQKTTDLILQEQLPIEQKRLKADSIIENTQDLDYLKGQVNNWLTWLTKN